MREIELEDDEILLLDGKVNEKAQELINEVKQFRKYINSGHILYAEIIAAAEKQAELRYTHRTILHCEMCNKSAKYPIYKSGRNKGKENRNKNRIRMFGTTFMDGFVTIDGYSKWGFCKECGEKAIKAITDYIKTNDLHIQLPRESKWIKEEKRECFNCKEKIWEFDMGLNRTLIGDGNYYAICNKCGAESNVFGGTHHSTRKVRAVEASTLKKVGNCWQRREE